MNGFSVARSSEGLELRRVFVLVWIYAGLGAIAALYACYKAAYDPAHSEFAGLPLIILALPWSWICRNFNPRIVPDQYSNNVIIETIFVFLNTVLLALIITFVQKAMGRGRVKA